MLHKIVDQYGNVFKGEVLQGKRHGRGTIVYKESRDVYQGDFENDVPHGDGDSMVNEDLEGECRKDEEVGDKLIAASEGVPKTSL